MSTPPDGSGKVPARTAQWVRAATDRVPTGWFAGILTGVFLAVTAAFGGLAAVAAPPIPELALGETHENDQFAITVERAVLIDELPDAGITVEPGQRVLALVVTAENRWDRAQPAHSTGGLSAAVRIAQLGEDTAPAAVARFDDATTSAYLQPRVPAQLVLTWAVDAAQFAADDELTVELRDLTLHEGKLVTYGRWWDTPVTAARLTVAVTDVGAGADAEGTGE